MGLVLLATSASVADSSAQRLFFMLLNLLLLIILLVVVFGTMALAYMRYVRRANANVKPKRTTSDAGDGWSEAGRRMGTPSPDDLDGEPDPEGR